MTNALKTLEGLKAKLVEQLEGLLSKYDNDIDLQLLIKLVATTPVNDYDFMEVLLDGTGAAIVELIISKFSHKEILSYIYANGLNIFNEYRFSEREYTKDYDPTTKLLVFNKEKNCYVKKWASFPTNDSWY